MPELKALQLAAKIKAGLKPNLDVQVFDELDSTNTFLKNQAENGAPGGKLCVALTQTAGRGRTGKSFLSFGEGLYMSLLYRPMGKTLDTVKVTAAAAVAVCESIRAVTGLNAEIKWVNDIYVDGRKVCGILTEGALSADGNGYDYIIVGIGVNLISHSTPDEIDGIASSLYNDGDASVPKALRQTLCTEIVNLFDSLFTELPASADKIYELYRLRSFIPGREINVISSAGVRSAAAIELLPDFTLRVKYDSGEEGILSSGEVSLKLK